MIIATYQDGSNKGQQITLPCSMPHIHVFEKVDGIETPVKARYVLHQRYYNSRTLGHVYDLYFDGVVKAKSKKKKSGYKAPKVKVASGTAPVGFTKGGYITGSSGQYANVIVSGTISNAKLNKALLNEISYSPFAKPLKFISVDPAEPEVKPENKNPSYETIKDSAIYSFLGGTQVSSGTAPDSPPHFSVQYIFDTEVSGQLAIKVNLKWKDNSGEKFGITKVIGKTDMDEANDPVSLITEALLTLEDKYQYQTGKSFPAEVTDKFLNSLKKNSPLKSYFLKSLKHHESVISNAASPVKISEAFKDIGEAAKAAVEETSKLTAKFDVIEQNVENNMTSIKYQINYTTPEIPSSEFSAYFPKQDAYSVYKQLFNSLSAMKYDD